MPCALVDRAIYFCCKRLENHCLFFPILNGKTMNAIQNAKHNGKKQKEHNPTFGADRKSTIPFATTLLLFPTIDDILVRQTFIITHLIRTLRGGNFAVDSHDTYKKKPTELILVTKTNSLTQAIDHVYN